MSTLRAQFDRFATVNGEPVEIVPMEKMADNYHDEMGTSRMKSMSDAKDKEKKTKELTGMHDQFIKDHNLKLTGRSVDMKSGTVSSKVEETGRAGETAQTANIHSEHLPDGHPYHHVSADSGYGHSSDMHEAMKKARGDNWK